MVILNENFVNYKGIRFPIVDYPRDLTTKPERSGYPIFSGR